MTQTTSADSAQGVAVLGLPELARTLAEAGLRVVTGDNFRAAASAANAALKVGPVPMVMADVAVAGTSPWVEKVVRQCPVAFVAVDLAEGQKRVAGNASAATRLPAPVAVDDVLAAVGLAALGAGTQLLADGTVTSGAVPAAPVVAVVQEQVAAPAPVAPVDEFSFGVDAQTPLPTPAPLPPVPSVPAPVVDDAPVAPEPAPAPSAAAAPVAPVAPAPVTVAAPTPPVPSFDFWGSAPALQPVAPAVPAPAPLPAPAPVAPPAPAVNLWADDPDPLQPPAAVEPDPAPWAVALAPVPPPVPAPVVPTDELDQLVAPVEQFGLPSQPSPAPAPVTPLPPVPQVPVPQVDATLDRVPPVPVAPAAAAPASASWQRQAVAAPPGQAPRPAVVIGEQIGVETSYSPTLGRQLAPCVFTLAGKGGVGKTSIAYALAQRAAVIGGLRAVLIDGNRGQGDLRTYLSLTRSGLPTIYDAVTTGDPTTPIVTPDRLNANRPEGAEELAIALVQAPPRGLAEPTTITSGLYHDVITAARGMADIVIVDTQIVEGSERGMFDELTIPMLASHAYGVGIADLSRPGVDNLIAHLAEFIAQGVPVERLMTMLNRVPATTEYDLQRTSDALSRYGAFLAAVPADPEVHSSMAYGTSIHDNPVLAPVLDAALMRITGNPAFAQTQNAAAADGGVAAPRKRGGLFRRGRG